MDATSGTGADVGRLNEQDKEELRHFIANETQIAQIQGRTSKRGHLETKEPA